MPRPKKSDSSSSRPKRVTLKDIAKVAGLHVMTVSDALSGARNVAPATRERVKQIARDLNYIPNTAAQALATGRTRLIAVMCGNISEVYYANMVSHLENFLHEDRYKVVLLRRPLELEELLDATGGTAVDGAVAIDMDAAIYSDKLIEQFRTHSAVPCVSIGAYTRSFVDSVVVDLSSAVTMALTMMVTAGRQRIAYLVTAPHLADEKESRGGAYLTTMQRHVRKPEIINADTNVLSEVEPYLKAYIRENGHPDALLCQNDETAMSAYRALRDLGLRIPDDVLLVGCDGQLHMKYFDPPLSTVVQPLEEICSVAWKFLKRRMADPTLPHQRIVLEGELVVRESLLPPLAAKGVTNDFFYTGREDGGRPLE
jgi:DNA-binding LacI/PurR family transcriptional regulator